MVISYYKKQNPFRMQLCDYFKLGFAGVRAHKKRAIMTVIIVGIIFSLIFVVYFLLQGAENLGFAKISQPTGGKILLSSIIDNDQCITPDDCQAKALVLSEKAEEFGGAIIENVSTVITNDGNFLVLPPEILKDAIQVDLAQVPTETTPILMPANTLATWQNIELFSEADRYNKDRAAVATKVVPKLEKLLADSLGQVITSPNGIKYYIAGFLPSSVGVAMSLQSVLRKGNAWLDTILTPISSGTSLPIILQHDNLVLLESTNMALIKSSDSPIISIFPDAKSAYEFRQSIVEQGFSSPEGLFGDVFSMFQQYQSLQQIVGTVANVLTVVAIIVIVTTYLRLLSQDRKIISIYFASGATKLQICLVYSVYLLILSILAIIFALCASSLATLLINLIYQTPLAQLFAFNFGTAKIGIMLFGWNGSILKYIILILIMAPLCVLMGQGNFSRPKLARSLKS